MQHLEVLSDAAQRTAAASFRSKGDLLAYFQNSFNAVVAEYIRIKQLSPVVGSIYHPEGFGRSERLTYDLIGYAVDVEKATEYGLRDHIALQPVWFQLAQSEAADAKQARQVIEKCGRIYSARRLEPWRYWSHTQRRAK